MSFVCFGSISGVCGQRGAAKCFRGAALGQYPLPCASTRANVTKIFRDKPEPHCEAGEEGHPHCSLHHAGGTGALYLCALLML